MIIDTVEQILADTKLYLEAQIAGSKSVEEQQEVAKQLLVRLIVATSDYWKCRRSVEYINNYVESLQKLLNVQPEAEEYKEVT